MKKLFVSTIMLTTLVLAGCTTPGTGVNTTTGTAIGTANEIGMNVFKAAINNKCRSELEQKNAWRVASAVMTAEQEATAKNKICGCVSEQAPQQVTIVELGNAAIDAEYRGKLVTRVVAKSLQTCYASFTK